jgi:hypothetical protein
MLSTFHFPEWNTLDFIGLDPPKSTRTLKFSSLGSSGSNYPYVSTFATWDEENDCEKEPDYSLNWPIFSKAMLEVLLSVSNFSYVDFSIAVDTENQDYIIVQLLEHLDIFDHDQSIYDPADIDSTLTKLVLKEPPGGYPPLFRVATIPNRLFVSTAARTALEAVNIKGLEFRYIDNFAWSTPPECQPFFLDYRDTPRENPRDLQLLDAYCPSYEEFKPLIAKTPEPIRANLQLEMTTDSELLNQTDYPTNSEQWPIISKRMLDVLLSVRAFEYQAIPLAVVNRGFIRDPQTHEWVVANPDSTEQTDEYVILHLLEHLDTFDWEQSEYEMHLKIDNWARNLRQLVLKEPANGYPPIFRMSPIAREWFISAEAREALEIAGIKGLKFQRVQDFRISG